MKEKIPIDLKKRRKKNTEENSRENTIQRRDGMIRIDTIIIRAREIKIEERGITPIIMQGTQDTSHLTNIEETNHRIDSVEISPFEHCEMIYNLIHM